MTYIDESQVEIVACDWLRDFLDYEYAYGPDISCDGDYAERDAKAAYTDVILVERLRSSLEQINPDLPAEAIEDAVGQITRLDSPSVIENNRRFHKMLTDGVDVSWMGYDGQQDDKVFIVDAADVSNNNFFAVNQFTVVEGKHQRRPDIVLFINGLPMVVIELKNPADENATLKNAYNQLQTYKDQLPAMFAYNELLIISDGMQARAGTLTSGYDRFMPWRSISGEDLYREPGNEKQKDGVLQPGLETLLKGLCNRDVLLDYFTNFITFEDDGGDSSSIIKKAAGYHQYHAVNKAIQCTLEATAESGDRKIGVIWHTQGSGKSLSMAFYAGKIVKHSRMENPTLVVVTDRNDLDDQLFGTFANNAELLRQSPIQAESREHLKELLTVPAGGVVFTTMQKFEEGGTISDRRNIVVIADEAHRSQYGEKAKINEKTGEKTYGMSKYMRDALKNASFIGFTGTPIKLRDKNTRAVFGDYIDKYDILRAVEDAATVPIYYESRLARIELDENEKPVVDPEFEEITEAEEEGNRKQQLRQKWSSLEAMVGTEKRIGLVAQDLVTHFELRQEGMEGKGLIVCMSRRICVDMYKAIIKLRPKWHSDDDDKGAIKVVMSGSSSDEQSWQPHIRSKRGREEIAKRFKKPDDDLKLVIVRDMWLTGFDCPSMHTMYVDKPMGGHNLMQAIARVNRVFKDKPGGRVVDYLGLADALKKALTDYTDSGGTGKPAVDQTEAVAVMREKYEVVCHLLHGFDYGAIIEAKPAERMSGIASAIDFILGLDDGKNRYAKAVSELSLAFALALPHEEALAIRDDVAVFQAIRTMLMKTTESGPKIHRDDMDSAIRQLVSRAVCSTDVLDIFEAAGLDKPDISILSDEFLAEVRQLPQRNLALELLKRLINDEIKTKFRKNVVQTRSFTEMLEEAIRKYQNRAITTAEVIEELIKLAKDLNEARARGDKLDLNEDERAFYDALGNNASAVEVMGDEKLAIIAQELLVSVKNSISIDWVKRKNARAKIRVMVKRILRKYGYPPDMQETATDLVLKQTEVLCEDWSKDF